jgi:methylenetetrahydrofolate reductase (NADPH)
MKITDHIKSANGKTLFSFELLPPVKGQSIQQIYNAIDPLMEFNPPFIDVTYHREDYIYKQHPNGLLEQVAYRKRPGTVAICAAIMNRYKVDAVPHLICGGFTKEETENALIDLQFLGIDNVLVLRGDARKADASFVPTPGGHAYACDLLEHVVNMNNGKYLHEDIDGSDGTEFCIGVAGYPEKHFEAPNLKTDFCYLKKKIEMGANFIVTQMFYDNQKYFDFVNLCRKNDINVPIIPGLKPITSAKQLITLPKIFHIDIPEDLSDAVAACKTPKEVKEVGIEHMIQQCKELMDFGAPVLHFYTMSNPEPTRRIAKAIF